MGGPGSGGFKSTPGDVETHKAWDVIDEGSDGLDGTGTRLPQVRCKYCAREMAQHTSRQRAHLLGCQGYLDAMEEQGIETSITRQAADPAAFFRAKQLSIAAGADAKPSKVLKIMEQNMAVRIQALALSEASIAAERIQEITGIDPRVLAGMRKLARERGYDPSVSMKLKEEYVLDPPNTAKPRGRPKKRKPGDELDPAMAQGPPTTRAPPGYLAADQLPPGNWNFMQPTGPGYTPTLNFS